MKTTTKLALLLAMLAAGSSAWAQTTLYVQAGLPYTFSEGTGADGVGNIDYQWYRNSEPIAGAIADSYDLPGSLAHGSNQEFRRGAVSDACPHTTVYANVFFITFLEPLVVGGIRWAQFNVAQSGIFAAKPDMYTEFYQWNRTTAWHATDASVSSWNSTADQSATWTNSGQPPCPSGWRLPTRQEFIDLGLASGGTASTGNNGGTWVAANARGNAVAGRFYGPNHATCSLPASMEGCIFLPAVGNRSSSDGSLSNQGSYGGYWSSTQTSSTNGYYLNFYSSSSNPSSGTNKALGMSIRCVQ